MLSLAQCMVHKRGQDFSTKDRRWTPKMSCPLLIGGFKVKFIQLSSVHIKWLCPVFLYGCFLCHVWVSRKSFIWYFYMYKIVFIHIFYGYVLQVIQSMPTEKTLQLPPHAPAMRLLSCSVVRLCFLHRVEYLCRLSFMCWGIMFIFSTTVNFIQRQSPQRREENSTKAQNMTGRQQQPQAAGRDRNGGEDRAGAGNRPRNPQATYDALLALSSKQGWVRD